MKQFILIGGAPTTGKSTLARHVAQHYGLPWISTDQLREVVRPYANEATHPTLFSAQMSAEIFLTRYSPQQIADMEYAQGDEVWPAVCGLLDGDSDWPDGCVIEGVNILPHLVAQEDYPNKEQVKPVFLVDLDEDRMRKVVYERGLYAPAHTYADDVKETEVQWAMLFAQRLQAEAEAYHMPCFNVTKSAQDFANILASLR